MPLKMLSANKPDEVSSSKMFDIFLGTPSYHLLVYTGIAIAEWDSQKCLDSEEVQINLGQPIGDDGQPIVIAQLINYTATIGLASISNEDSDFTFSTDNIGLNLTPDGELVVIAHISVQGEPSWLHRFSYQVNAIIDVDEPLISGAIFWTPDTAEVASMNRTDNLFTITAVTDLPPAPGAFAGGTEVVAMGEVTGALLEQPLNIHTGFPGRLMVPYVIRKPPLNTPMHVSVSIQPGAFSPPFPYTLALKQVSGPSTIVLALDHLKEPNVNFELSASQQPH